MPSSLFSKYFAKRYSREVDHLRDTASSANRKKWTKREFEEAGTGNRPVQAASKVPNKRASSDHKKGASKGASTDHKKGASKAALPRVHGAVGPPLATSHDAARDLISVEQHWLSTTKLLESKRAFKAIFTAHAVLHAACSDSGRQHAIVKHAMSVGGRQHDADSVYGFIKGRSADEQKELALAWLLIATHETQDGIFTLVERTKDRIHRCGSAQKQAYVMLVQQGSAYLTNPPTTREMPWADIRDALTIATGAVAVAGGSGAHTGCVCVCETPSSILVSQEEAALTLQSCVMYSSYEL